MMISLIDNSLGQRPFKEVGCSPDVKEELKEIAGKSIKSLQESGSNKDSFLFFPSGIAQKELEEKDFIFSIKDLNSDNPVFETGNVMGFFGLKSGSLVKITSRFDQNNDKNFFLRYMLQKICNVGFAPKTYYGKEEIFEFLYYLFPNYLNKACAQGIFRSYITREYNDANVRGPVDVNRHIRFNEPFNGKIAYRTREYITDNHVTQLVRHTIEYIRCMKDVKPILESCCETRDNVNSIVAATPSYSLQSRNRVISKNICPVTHPFFTAYEPLRKLCIAILTHKTLGYGEKRNKPIQGILFDGASLWEEYLWTVLKESNLNLTHANNREKDKGIRLLKKGWANHYPDFYRKKTAEHQAAVLDAKYKRLCYKKNDKNYSRDDDECSTESNDNYRLTCSGKDVMQMLAYMHALESKQAVLMSPFEIEEKIEGIQDSLVKKNDTCGYGGQIDIIAMPIYTNAENYPEFSKYMKKAEKNFIEKIQKLFNGST